ncbi:MAG: hypothetical protein KJ789_17435, partial [Alphaproteobacteria bacterium]|nr:hypothetical protein [Alphaproteobacteria bacterium]
LGLEPPAIIAIGRPGFALLAVHFIEKGNAPALSTQHAVICRAPDIPGLRGASCSSCYVARRLRGHQAYDGDANRARAPWQAGS